MGPKRVDDKQTKISSFFSNGQSTSSSKLFSSVSQACCPAQVSSKRGAALLAFHRKSLKVSKNKKCQHDETDVILIDTSDRSPNVKDNLSDRKVNIKATGPLKQDDFQMKREELQDSTLDCLSGSCNSGIKGSREQERNHSDQFSAKKCPFSQCNKGQSSDCFITKSDMVVPKHTVHDQDETSMLPNVHDPTLCRTPIRTLPDKTDICNGASPDIVFDTPNVDVKKFSFLNNNFFNTEDGTEEKKSLHLQDSSNHQKDRSYHLQGTFNLSQDCFEKFSSGKGLTHEDREHPEKGGPELITGNLSGTQHETDLKENSKDLVIVTGGGNVEDIEIPSSILVKAESDKKSSSVELSRDTSYLYGSNESNEFEVSSSFQPTVLKHYHGQKAKSIRMSCRTMSDSKLLSALQQAEADAQERETRQKINEKIVQGLNKSILTSAVFPNHCEDFKRPGSGLFSPQPNPKRKNYSRHTFPQCGHQKALMGHVDLTLGEDSLAVCDKFNKGHYDYKEDFTKSVLAKMSGKKKRKSVSKFIEDCNLQSDSQSKEDLQEVTLKDDPILQQLMNKLHPAKPGKENVITHKTFSHKNIDVLKPSTSKFASDHDRRKHDSSNLSAEAISEMSLSALPVFDPFSLQIEDFHKSLTSRSSNRIHVLPPKTKQQEKVEDFIVIDDSADSERITCSPVKSSQSLEKLYEHGRMKRKLSETNPAVAPNTKRIFNAESSIIVVREDKNLASIPKMDTHSANLDSSLDLSDAASAETNMLAKYEAKTSISKADTDLIPSSTSQDVSVGGLKPLSSKNSSETSIPSSPFMKLLSSVDDVKQKQSPDGQLSDITSSTLLHNSQVKHVLKGCVDLPADKIQDPVFVEAPGTQLSDIGIMDFDDTFNFQDNSLLLSATVDDMIQLRSASVHFGAVDRDKSEFRFVDLWQRFVVKTVSENCNKREKYLGLMKHGHSILSHRCILNGFWTDTLVREGDVVNVLAPFENSQCVISDTSGFLVVNPDSLMSGTAVVSSVFCMRKSVLNEIVKGQDSGNIHMLHGTFLHSLFQIVLKKNIMDKDEIIATAKTILSSSKFLHEMYSHSVSEAKVWEEIDGYIPAVISWVSRHMQADDVMVKGDAADDIIVTDIEDVEENIWSPRLGLKGKIDVTVKVRSRQGRKERTLPLEVKTGKASFSAEHKGQVMLYSMMYGDRRVEPGEGILLYLKHSEMEIVTVKPQSQSGLIQLRNSMSSFLNRLVEETQLEDGNSAFKLGHLPEPINNQRSCSKCPHLTTCCMYQKSVEKMSHSDGHAMKHLGLETLAHLDEEDLAYFEHWALCLLLENHQSNKTKLKQIWTLSSQEREKCGDCLSNLVIVSSELGIPETQGFTEGQGCSLTFVRHISQTGSSLDLVGLNANDSVVVSSEDGRWIALATGFIRNISSTHVEVVVDRDTLYDTSSYTDVKFRLDRNDSFSTHGTLLANVSRLMEPSPHAAKMRRLIIKRTPPSFEMKIPMAWVKKIKPIFKDLNKPQKSAILKVLMAKDFVLIRGFPGSGKTTAIVALVKVLNILGLSLLITSYTHSAVDNIALKLKQDGVPFLRLGRQSRLHPHILSHSAEILTTRLKSVQELSDFYASYNIVATSCLGMNHPLFTKKRFDVCIVDEASQVLQPACLGPLFNCDKFVLVGDGQQLPPLVQSKQARLLGMDESLFTRLEDGGSTYDLNLQYRMNETIMTVSNLLVYDGKLKCGSAHVAGRCLSIDSNCLKDCPVWLAQALNCDIKKSVTFINTGQTCDTVDGNGCCNEMEAELVIMLLERLVKVNVRCKDIGVISPYRSQVKLLLQKSASRQQLSGIEINTVDQYQGRDKTLIIVSFVYSRNSVGGQLLKDKRRLNVALTRAQSKLILVGNAQALRSIDGHLEVLVSHLEKSDNIIQLDNTEIDDKV